MKKSIHLILCGALLAGALSIGAGAAEPTFTDASEIQHWQAVDTMARLGVINGNDDGSFAPAGLVTRAEAAKLLAVMLNGGSQELTLPKGSPFPPEELPVPSDVQDHWAKDYIAYCVQQGIIAGRGDGTFDPDGQVTCSELSKMALVALGYDPTVFGLTGQDWEIDTMVLSNQPVSQFYTDLKDIDHSEPITREQTAQLLYNVLFAQVMGTSVRQDEESGPEPLTVYSLKKDEEGQAITFLMEHFDPAVAEQFPTPTAETEPGSDAEA